MFVTDKDELKKYQADKRIWQGIPGIEVTKNGRMFSAFYSGGTNEGIGNYAVLIKSDDGINFSEPIAVAVPDTNHRAFDPCLWIDPLDRLWFIWAVEPDHAVWAVICDTPDADELIWSDERIIGHDVMINKPTVLTTGEWLFPMAIWDNQWHPSGVKTDGEPGSYVYKTIDNGETFTVLGKADVPKRAYDEHMVIELDNAVLMMLVRTHYGIGVSYSYDRGKTWTAGMDSGLAGPCSRFCIRRLKSGRIILVNHYEFDGRNNLTAMLSEDEGKTWKYRLLIDERDQVSYPDLKEATDGYIYITYDRERGSFRNCFEDVEIEAREILYAKITEADIINGSISTEDSRLKMVINKLNVYDGDADNLFNDKKHLSDAKLAEYLLNNVDGTEIIDRVFDMYPVNCIYVHEVRFEKIDRLIDAFINSGYTDAKSLVEIISTMRMADCRVEISPIVGNVMQVIKENISEEINVKDIAEKLHCSVYHMSHEFKKHTGISVLEYRNSIRLIKAKELLISSDESIGAIARKCGFNNASYFAKIFIREEGITPTYYREHMKR